MDFLQRLLSGGAKPAAPRPVASNPYAYDAIPKNLAQLPTQNADTGRIMGQRVGTSVFGANQAAPQYYDPSGKSAGRFNSSGYLALPLRTNLQPLQHLQMLLGGR